MLWQRMDKSKINVFGNTGNANVCRCILNGDVFIYSCNLLFVSRNIDFILTLGVWHFLIMESGCPLYLCRTEKGLFLVFAWKGRLDWAIKGQGHMPGSEYETHSGIPLFYLFIQCSPALLNAVGLGQFKNRLMQKARFTFNAQKVEKLQHSA